LRHLLLIGTVIQNALRMRFPEKEFWLSKQSMGTIGHMERQYI